MELNEFIEKCSALTYVPYMKRKSEYASRWENSRKDVEGAIPVLHYSWVTGGITGGGCWDGMRPDTPVSADKEPETSALDEVLEEFWPDISYLQYKKLMLPLWKEGSDGYSDYYGNSTEYTTKTMPLADLYEVLKDNGKL